MISENPPIFYACTAPPAPIFFKRLRLFVGTMEHGNIPSAQSRYCSMPIPTRLIAAYGGWKESMFSSATEDKSDTGVKSFYSMFCFFCLWVIWKSPFFYDPLSNNVFHGYAEVCQQFFYIVRYMMRVFYFFQEKSIMQITLSPWRHTMREE